MSVLSRFSRDEIEKRMPERLRARTGRASTSIRSKVEQGAKAGRDAARGARRSLAGQADRQWPKRAGIAAAAAGAVGGATAFLRDPERRGALVGKALAPLKAIQSPNDETIAERVRSEIFRPADAPKGMVNVNVEQAVVYLRGEVPDEAQIQRVITAAGAVQGVKRVESLLHTPGKEAPSASNGRAKVESVS